MRGQTENKIQRLQWIQMTLAGRQRITTKQIMDHFGVGKTTTKTDLDYFKKYNVIEWSGQEKCYVLIDKLKSLPGLFISQKEWLVFTFTELMLSKHAAAFSSQMRKFQERYKKDMNRLLPTSNIDQYFSVNTTRTEEIDNAVFETCVYAVAKQVVLRFEYHKPFEMDVEERVVSPYHLVNENGQWLMISWDHDKQAFRNFMPSRIRQIWPEIGVDFILRSRQETKTHLYSSYGLYKGEKKFNAELLFSERKSIWADHQFWHADAKKKWIGKRLKLTLPIASLEGIMEEILSHGPDIEVLSPVILRDAVKNKLKQALEIYE